MESNELVDLRTFMEKWQAQRDPRGDDISFFVQEACKRCHRYGHGYVSYDLLLEEDVYRLYVSVHFITAIHVTADENVTVNVTVTIVNYSAKMDFFLLSLGKVSLTRGENRLPFIGKVKPLMNCFLYISFFRDTDGYRYTPTKVTAIGMFMHRFNLNLTRRIVLRMTPSANYVITDGYMSIEPAEMGPWMKYGAFLWLLRKHYKDIITRLYRPGGLMAKRMERNIYGN